MALKNQRKFAIPGDEDYSDLAAELTDLVRISQYDTVLGVDNAPETRFRGH